jgi:hypothetical protein
MVQDRRGIGAGRRVVRGCLFGRFQYQVKHSGENNRGGGQQNYFFVHVFLDQ